MKIFRHGVLKIKHHASPTAELGLKLGGFVQKTMPAGANDLSGATLIWGQFQCQSGGTRLVIPHMFLTMGCLGSFVKIRFLGNYRRREIIQAM